MWRITLKGAVAHRLRYALTALAVLLGVAFIVGTFVLTDTINSTFNPLTQVYQEPPPGPGHQPSTPASTSPVSASGSTPAWPPRWPRCQA
jgi:putative ABC transport system permease protein